MSFRIDDILKDNTKKRGVCDDLKTNEDDDYKRKYTDDCILEKTLLDNSNYSHHRHQTKYSLSNINDNNNGIVINNANISEIANRILWDYPRIERNYYAMDNYNTKGYQFLSNIYYATRHHANNINNNYNQRYWTPSSSSSTTTSGSSSYYTNYALDASNYPNYSKRKGGQVRFTTGQTDALEKRFVSHKYLSPEDRKILADNLKLSDRQVKTWFQNRRAKWRRVHNISTSSDTNNEHESEITEGIRRNIIRD